MSFQGGSFLPPFIFYLMPLIYFKLSGTVPSFSQQLKKNHFGACKGLVTFIMRLELSEVSGNCQYRWKEDTEPSSQMLLF